jgi:hypothetical protein
MGNYYYTIISTLLFLIPILGIGVGVEISAIIIRQNATHPDFVQRKTLREYPKGISQKID